MHLPFSNHYVFYRPYNAPISCFDNVVNINISLKKNSKTIVWHLTIQFFIYNTSEGACLHI